VHYSLLSVSGGGGVAQKFEDLTGQKKRALLLNEIKSFPDPALLAGNIFEPNGTGFSRYPEGNL